MLRARSDNCADQLGIHRRLDAAYAFVVANIYPQMGGKLVIRIAAAVSEGCVRFWKNQSFGMPCRNDGSVPDPVAKVGSVKRLS